MRKFAAPYVYLNIVLQRKRAGHPFYLFCRPTERGGHQRETIPSHNAQKGGSTHKHVRDASV